LSIYNTNQFNRMKNIKTFRQVRAGILNENRGPEDTSFFQKIYPVISSPSNFPEISEEEVLGVLSALSQGEPSKGFNSKQKNLYNQLERNNKKYLRQLEKDAGISQNDIDSWQDSLGY